MRLDEGAGRTERLNPDRARLPAAGIARGAALIAGLSILARMLGLARTLVFARKIGAGCLGTAYVTANQVPNLVYELILGGALTSAMVPVLARSAEEAETDPARKAHVSQISSALLTWSVHHIGSAYPGYRGSCRADRRAAEPRQRERSLRSCRTWSASPAGC